MHFFPLLNMYFFMDRKCSEECEIYYSLEIVDYISRSSSHQYWSFIATLIDWIFYYRTGQPMSSAGWLVCFDYFTFFSLVLTVPTFLWPYIPSNEMNSIEFERKKYEIFELHLCENLELRYLVYFLFFNVNIFVIAAVARLLLHIKKW